MDQGKHHLSVSYALAVQGVGCRVEGVRFRVNLKTAACIGMATLNPKPYKLGVCLDLL